MLKLKLQYFGHLMWRADSLAKTLILWKIEGRRRRGWQSMQWLGGITDSVDMNLSKLWKIVKDREAWRAAVHGFTKSQTWLEWLNNTTILKLPILAPWQNLEHCYKHLEVLDKTEEIFKFIANLRRNKREIPSCLKQRQKGLHWGAVFRSGNRL